MFTWLDIIWNVAKRYGKFQYETLKSQKYGLKLQMYQNEILYYERLNILEIVLNLKMIN